MFAVVAFFEAPLGLNVLVGRFEFLGHVAVLPRRQQQIAEMAGAYVESLAASQVVGLAGRLRPQTAAIHHSDPTAPLVPW